MSKQTTNIQKDLDELERIVKWFESGDVDLDAALAKFEQGMELVGGLKKQLETVENKVERIKAKFDTKTADEVAEPDLEKGDAEDTAEDENEGNPTLI